MISFNRHNKSSKDLYKSEESTLDKVVGAITFIAFVVIVAVA